ncbi:sortase domain-containing protein [Arthrobacter sp. H14]|uniref:sortase domain-containing protein n=1 Tax=Arthrobacter sp. H14 TaxID=1312959 RepID=UPI0012DC3F32|nr:sortase [Arthrobacter sp. H14]
MMNSYTGRRIRNTAGSAAVLLLLLAGCGSPNAGSEGEAGGNTAPKPSASAPASPNPPPSSSNTSGAMQAKKATPPEAELAMEASQPVGFSIPALDRQDDIIKTGLREDNSLEVPPEHEGAPASWYKGSPTPGETGPAVLLGHVNSLADESGVFYELESLVEGDTVAPNYRYAPYHDEQLYRSTFPQYGGFCRGPPASARWVRLSKCGGRRGSGR